MKNLPSILLSCVVLLSVAQAAPMSGPFSFNVPTHPPRVLVFNVPTHPPRVLAFNVPTHPPLGLGFNVPTHPPTRLG